MECITPPRFRHAAHSRLVFVSCFETCCFSCTRPGPADSCVTSIHGLPLEHPHTRSSSKKRRSRSGDDAKDKDRIKDKSERRERKEKKRKDRERCGFAFLVFLSGVIKAYLSSCSSCSFTSLPSSRLCPVSLTHTYIYPSRRGLFFPRSFWQHLALCSKSVLFVSEVYGRRITPGELSLFSPPQMYVCIRCLFDRFRFWSLPGRSRGSLLRRSRRRTSARRRASTASTRRSERIM